MEKPLDFITASDAGAVDAAPFERRPDINQAGNFFTILIKIIEINVR
jgi:hypothetical protein